MKNPRLLEQRLRDAAIELAQAELRLRADRISWSKLKERHDEEDGVCIAPSIAAEQLCEACIAFLETDLHAQNVKMRNRAKRRIITAYEAMTRNVA